MLTRFFYSSDLDSGKGGPEAEEEDVAGLPFETLFIDDELTPALSSAALRSESTSTPSVTPLGELLALLTATSQQVEEGKVDGSVRDSTTEIDLGDTDESRFSAVALNIRSSKRSSVASPFNSRDRRSSTASFLLAKAQDTQFRHSLDGDRELQDEFEKVHASEDDADAAARGVDWGMFSMSFLPKRASLTSGS